MQRFLLRGLKAEMRLGDSLIKDCFADLQVDAVVCDPPFNLRNPLLERDPLAAPWASFAANRARTADLLWLEHALAHLQPGGRAYVVLPAGSLFRSGREREVRTELIRRGVVEAVVSLPAGTAQHTTVQLALWVLRGSDSSNDPVLMVDASQPNSERERPRLSDSRSQQVAAILERWQRAGIVGGESEVIATAVPIVELFASDADLTPSRWVQTAAAVPAEERAKNAQDAIARFAAVRNRLVHVGAAAPTFEEPLSVEWVNVRDLAASDVAEVVRGVRFRQEDRKPEGVRVLRTRDIRDTITNDEPWFADLADLRPQPTLTERGDIILSPASGKLRAVVDEGGGHILASPLQALRFRTDLMDPHVAAAFLESPRNRRFAKGTNWGYARVDLRDLELPVLPLEEAHRLRIALDQLATAEHDARELVEEARAARESILDVVGAAGDQPWN
jgi:hypothetical protein